MPQDLNVSGSAGGSPDGPQAHIDAVGEARHIIEANDAVGDPAKVDRLASRLMLRLNTYERGREFGLDVIAELRSAARRLGFAPAMPSRVWRKPYSGPCG